MGRQLHPPYQNLLYRCQFCVVYVLWISQYVTLIICIYHCANWHNDQLQGNISVTVYQSTEVILQFSEIFWNHFVCAISTQILFFSRSNIPPWPRGAAHVAQRLLQQQCRVQVPQRWFSSHYHAQFTAFSVSPPLFGNVSLGSSRKLLYGCLTFVDL